MRPKIGLGDIARDTITGFEGVVVAITDWLNGCQRVSIQAAELKDGKPIDSVTFDAEQVCVVERAEKITPSETGGPSIAPTRNPDPV